jgi:hypothetical protein
MSDVFTGWENHKSEIIKSSQGLVGMGTSQGLPADLADLHHSSASGVPCGADLADK